MHCQTSQDLGGTECITSGSNWFLKDDMTL